MCEQWRCDKCIGFGVACEAKRMGIFLLQVRMGYESNQVREIKAIKAKLWAFFSYKL